MSDVQLLLIDDDTDALSSLKRALISFGLDYSINIASSIEEATCLSAKLRPHVVVLDLSLSISDGVEGGFKLLSELRQLDSSSRIIVLTGHAGVRHGVRALLLGAASFLEKPADVPHIIALIRDGVAQCNLRRAFDAMAVEQAAGKEMFLGDSPAIHSVLDGIKHAAKTNQAVLITGETGTGKGLAAFVIHTLSLRSKGRFIRFQPHFGAPELAQSALFGHVKGAFTGAVDTRKGLVVEADGGSLFLDEVDELPRETQIALLEVLQDRKLRALGSNREIETDFRLIAASNADIERCVEDGEMRADFFHRISHFRIHIPPLRERLQDIDVLSAKILSQIRLRESLSVADIEKSALDSLYQYQWPGNVRELQAVIEDAAYRAEFNGRLRITQSDLRLRSPARAAESRDLGLHQQVEKFKRKLVEGALSRNAENQVWAARELGIDRSTIRRILSGPNDRI